ncbi:MAG: hypothetical protein CW346_19040 [Bacillaceae bacterium]|nr:hypothetical protein [Bacillaceae bacterium]
MLRKYQTLRFLYYWIYVFFSIGIPSILISLKYDVFESVSATPAHVKLAGGGMMIIIIAFFFLRGQLNEMIKEMEPSPIKTTVIQVKRCMPILVIYLILKFAKIHIDNLMFITLWSFVSNLLGSIFNVLHMRYKVKVKDLRLEAKIQQAVHSV